MTKQRRGRQVCPPGTAPKAPQSPWAHAPGAKARGSKAACLRGRTARTEAWTRAEPPSTPRARRRWKTWAAAERERAHRRTSAGVHGAKVLDRGRGLRGRQCSCASQ